MRVHPAVVVVLIETLCFVLSGAERVNELRGGFHLKDAQPHFMANTYGFLKTSGDRVGAAVQSILGVQGRIDDMVEDLSGEYARWQWKQKHLLTERNKYNQDIGYLQAEVLRMAQVKEQKDRLLGDLAVQAAARAQQDVMEKAKRLQWQTEQAGLRADIHKRSLEIEERQRERQESLAAIQNETNTIQQQHRDVQDEIARLNKEIAEFQEKRLKQKTAAAREHNGLLKEITAVQDEIKALQKQLLAQAQLEVEHRRLAAQAREVSEQREAYERSRTNCTQMLSRLDANVAVAKRTQEEANAAIIECQELDVVNQKLQAQLSKCRAVNYAGQM